MKTCTKCTNLLCERWDVELREWEKYCVICGYIQKYTTPKPIPFERRGLHKKRTYGTSVKVIE